jgi:general secretion pathway protein J
LRLQGALGQWTADLDAITDTQEVSPLDFDGRGLRMTRRDATETGLESPGVRVVAWALRDGQWMRWQSPTLQHRDDLARAWQRATVWIQGMGASQPASTGDSAVAVAAAEQWRIYYHRGETWVNPQSSTGNETTESGTTQSRLPNGVRLVLTLTAGQPIQGTLTRDWVRPTMEAGQ